MTSTESDGQNPEEKNLDIEILSEEYAQYDLSFKIIVIGNSGKKIFLYNNNICIIYLIHIFKKNRCWQIMFICPGD